MRPAGAAADQCLERGSQEPAKQAMEGIGKETRHGSELPSVLIVCGFPQEVTSPLSLKISVSGRDSQLDQKIRYF